MDDSESDVCISCNDLFTMRNRKHHCRKCGILVCGNCSEHFIDLSGSQPHALLTGRRGGTTTTTSSSSSSSTNNRKPQRVCDNCFRDHRSAVAFTSHDFTSLESLEKGILFKVIIREARELSHDPSSSSSSQDSGGHQCSLRPYLSLMVGGELISQSDVEPHTFSPQWNFFSHLLIPTEEVRYVVIEVRDSNSSSSSTSSSSSNQVDDPVIGRCRVSLFDIPPQSNKMGWFVLADFKKGEKGGLVHVTIQRGMDRTSADNQIMKMKSKSNLKVEQKDEDNDKQEEEEIIDVEAATKPRKLTAVTHPFFKYHIPLSVPDMSYLNSYISSHLQDPSGEPKKEVNFELGETSNIPLLSIFPPSSKLFKHLFWKVSETVVVPLNEMLIEVIENVDLSHNTSHHPPLRGVLLLSSHRLIFIPYSITKKILHNSSYPLFSFPLQLPVQSISHISLKKKFKLPAFHQHNSSQPHHTTENSSYAHAIEVVMKDKVLYYFSITSSSEHQTYHNPNAFSLDDLQETSISEMSVPPISNPMMINLSSSSSSSTTIANSTRFKINQTRVNVKSERELLNQLGFVVEEIGWLQVEAVVSMSEITSIETRQSLPIRSTTSADGIVELTFDESYDSREEEEEESTVGEDLWEELIQQESESKIEAGTENENDIEKKENEGDEGGEDDNGSVESTKLSKNRTFTSKLASTLLRKVKFGQKGGDMTINAKKLRMEGKTTRVVDRRGSVKKMRKNRPTRKKDRKRRMNMMKTFHSTDLSNSEHKIELSQSQTVLMSEYERLGLAGGSSGMWRISTTNLLYALCPTYPSLICVPSSISDDYLSKSKVYRSKGRIPSATWRNRKNGAILCRSSQPYTGLTERACPEDERLLGAIRETCDDPMSSSFMSDLQSVRIRNFDPTKLNNVLINKLERQETGNPPLDIIDGISPNPSTHLMERYQNSVEDGNNKNEEDDPNRRGSSEENGSHTLSTGDVERVKLGNKRFKTFWKTQDLSAYGNSSSSSTSGNDEPSNHQLMPFYGDYKEEEEEEETEVEDSEVDDGFVRVVSPNHHGSSFDNAIKLRIIDARPIINAKGNQFLGKGYEVIERLGGPEMSSIEFMKIENIHEMRGSINLLRSACLEWDESFNSKVEESGWLSHLSCILSGSLLISDYLSKGNPVLVHCSDGWDRTSQLCSTAQILMDKHYSTLDGFIALVQKDWLSYGYQFEKRNGRHSDERSPVFVQFLDVCWQIWRQFPSCFEFNEAFLRDLALFSQSGWFFDFYFDCERLRENFIQSQEELEDNCEVFDETETEPRSIHFASIFSYFEQNRDKYLNLVYYPNDKIRFKNGGLNVGSQCLEVWKDVYFSGLPQSKLLTSKYERLVERRLGWLIKREEKMRIMEELKHDQEEEEDEEEKDDDDEMVEELEDVSKEI